ncbi:MAG: hypothetical protein V2I33_03740 [Kangiellaceae bacterium]|jgi:hypothetical protein|nr:hypothetical protein [Kangiellaceae bacterium]
MLSYFLIASVIIIPLLLLASPILLFAVKQRSDLGLYYFIALTATQVLIVGIYWQNMIEAATWIVIMIGLSQSIGCIFSWYKSRSIKWLQYSIIAVILSFSMLLLSGGIVI